VVTGERRPNVTKAEQICERFRSNPFARITDVAREFGTSRAQVRRVLKREGLYDQLKRMPLVTPAEKHEKSIATVEFFLCDLHIPHHDEKALSIAYREMLDVQPDRIWIGGDLLDFHKISHFNRDPEEADIADEIEKGKDFIAQLRTDFPNAEIVLEGGNHDDGRWEAYLSNTNIKGVDGIDIDQILNLDMFDVKYISAQEEKQLQGVWPRRGLLYHIHGHEYRIGYGAINVAKLMKDRAGDNTIFGHFHRTQEYYWQTISGDIYGCWSVGCLCDLNPRFAPGNRWNHGFAVIYYHEDGTFEVQNKKIVKGMVV
jgi:predicted phosphodiesterase